MFLASSQGHLNDKAVGGSEKTVIFQKQKASFYVSDLAVMFLGFLHGRTDNLSKCVFCKLRSLKYLNRKQSLSFCRFFMSPLVCHSVLVTLVF